MKRILFSVFLLLALSSVASSQSLCTVSDTLYDAFGQPARNVEVKFTPHSGGFVLLAGRTTRTNARGVFSVTLIQGLWYYVQAPASNMVGRLDQGVKFQVPFSGTADLSVIVPASTIPNSYPVAVPTLAFTDSTGARTVVPDTLHIGTGLLLVNKGGGSSDYTLISTATGSGAAYGDSIKVAYDQIGGKGDSDSLSTAYAAAAAALPKSDTTALHAQLFAALNDKDAGYADGDSVSVQIKAVKDLIGGKGDSDSLSTAYSTAAAALPKADTTALHAQKFAVLNDQVAGLADGDSVSVQVRLIKDLLGAKGDSDSLSTAYSTASAALPLASLDDSLDAMTTGGARSFSAAGRMFVEVDSLTLDGLTNTLDCSLGNEWRTTTTQATDTIYFSNWIEGQAVTIAVTQGGTGQTVVFDGVRFVTAPTLTATQYKADVFTFIRRGNIVYGTYVQGF